MKAMKTKIPIGFFAIAAWIIVNILFMFLELTLFNDSADLNNTILLVLWLSSLIALFSMKKWGAAYATFVFIYAFSFNAFNIIYFGKEIALLNGISAILNAIAVVYAFRSIFANNFK